MKQTTSFDQLKKLQGNQAAIKTLVESLKKLDPQQLKQLLAKRKEK